PNRTHPESSARVDDSDSRPFSSPPGLVARLVTTVHGSFCAHAAQPINPEIYSCTIVHMASQYPNTILRCGLQTNTSRRGEVRVTAQPGVYSADVAEPGTPLRSRRYR